MICQLRHLLFVKSENGASASSRSTVILNPFSAFLPPRVVASSLKDAAEAVFSARLISKSGWIYLLLSEYLLVSYKSGSVVVEVISFGDAGVVTSNNL